MVKGDRDKNINILFFMAIGALIAMIGLNYIPRKDTCLERMEKQLDRLLEIHIQGHVIVTPELKPKPIITEPLPKIDEDVPHEEDIPHVH